MHSEHFEHFSHESTMALGCAGLADKEKKHRRVWQFASTSTGTTAIRSPSFGTRAQIRSWPRWHG